MHGGPAEGRVQQLLREDDQFRQEYDFQKQLMEQVQVKRRQELTSLFARFEADRSTTGDEQDAVPVIPMPRTDNDGVAQDPKQIRLWQQTWIRVAASVAVVIGIGFVVWWQTSPPANGPGPVVYRSDSAGVQPPRDSQQTNPVELPRLPAPPPQGPVAQKPTQPNRLTGARQLPYYETEDVSFGFGTGQKTTAYRTVVFAVGSEPTYEFDDTLTVYLPVPPPAKPAWLLVYNRTSDTYYLTTGKTRYEIVKGLRGKQPLLKVN